MITNITEGAVDPSFLTSQDVSDMRADIPVKSDKIDELMAELANKMGIDEKVPWENIDEPVQVDAAIGVSGISNVESVADSISQQGAPSIWIIKKLLAQTKASPNLKINGKPLTSDVTFTVADFNMYDAATVRAKFSTLPTPAKAMVMGPVEEHPTGGNEIGSGRVLVNVKYDPVAKTWSGVYRPVHAILQDGTTQVVPFS
jgi:hypothetical protein